MIDMHYLPHYELMRKKKKENDGLQKDSRYAIQIFCLNDDVVMITLTVREHLQFSAALRLPTTMTDHEKNERINILIAKLGLDGVADSKVLSKDERKRTSVAIELITDPPVLFLDEPMTGLDSSTAHAVISLLKKYMRQQHCFFIYLLQIFDYVYVLSILIARDSEVNSKGR
ncbi:ATP-binding cassette sub-family G member 2-like [Octodon degus]|uniref:ATP-binding cassette sub-family G member 2-like n=1 Tax=Octodon degus TaxID=10160 RepID=A0A6P6DRJ6_OCTDE|nr:ATP-binding cassette sub-family G member 2-like [Octodon degus]